MKNMIIGIDIGGTTVKMGILKSSGEIVYKWEIPTDTSNQGNAIINHICLSIDNTLKEHNIAKQDIMGIGIGAPGFINAKRGYVYEAVNIGWKNIALTKEIETKLGLPTFLENDANTAALGENWLGAGLQNKDVLAVTLGTGVGGGVIANGEILNGANGTAGEMGHMTIDSKGRPCNCGRRGCLETIVSATGMVNQAIEKIENHPDSLLAKRYEEFGKITTKDIFELDKEDRLAEGIINHTTDVLGLSLANVAAVLNPSKILIGGGVSKAGSQLLDRLTEAFNHYALPSIREVCEVKLARLSNDAGIIGASFLVKQHIEKVKF